MAHRVQCDITYSGQDFLSLPRFLPGRLNTDDFVFFNWPNNFNSSGYHVVISTNDVAGPTYRRISKLAGQVEVPFVQLDAYAVIGVIHETNENKPQFWSRLNRGSTYSIPEVSQNRGAKYEMTRHGVLTAAVSQETYLV